MIGFTCGPLSSFTPRRRPAYLKALLGAVVLGMCASVGLALPISVPDTIMLPDSLGPLRPPYHLAFGSSTDNIYVASESSDIMVVDGNTFQRIKRINTGTPVGGALLVSQHNRLYCSYLQQGRVGVIDYTTNDTVGSIEVSKRPKLLCYNSDSDKLYCADSFYFKVSVIDCAADTVIKVISTGAKIIGMICDPTTNKVYVETKYALLVISCATDSIIRSIDGEYRSGMCLNKRRQKLYVPGTTSPATLYVVSTQTDSVTDTIPTGSNILACNEATDRLYSAGGEGVNEYDCLGDTYTGCGYFPRCEARAIACDTVRNRLLFRSTYDLLVIDCLTFDVVANVGAPSYRINSDPLVLDPSRYRAMSTGWREGWGALTICDYKGDTAYYRGGVPLCGWGNSMSHNPATSRLYCSLGTGAAAVVDEQTNRQVGLARGVGGSMVYSRTSNKFYFRVSSGLGVMDGAGDSLLKYIHISDGRWDPFPCWCPIGNKMYCFADKGARLFMAAVDCSTDSVMWERDMYDLGRWFEYLDNGLMLVNHTDSLALIDPRTDSVLAESSLAAGGVYAVTHTGDGKKFYLARFGRLEVRSSSSLALLKTIAWPYFGSAMGTSLAYSDTARKLYWFVGDSALAIDATSDTVTTRVTTTELYDGPCLDHTGNYLFCASYDTLSVYDMRSDSLVAVYPQLQSPLLRITSSPEQHRIYLGCPDVILVYPDVPPGVEETPSADMRATKSGPTVVRGVLFLPEAANHRPKAACLMDISGRNVLDLKPGANDVRTLAPGVYFIRGPKTEDGRPNTAVRKIVVTRM
jgi:DNA-binding beta-propeller fold protein YncE